MSAAKFYRCPIGVTGRKENRYEGSHLLFYLRTALGRFVCPLFLSQPGWNDHFWVCLLLGTGDPGDPIPELKWRGLLTDALRRGERRWPLWIWKAYCCALKLWCLSFGMSAGGASKRGPDRQGKRFCVHAVNSVNIKRGRQSTKPHWPFTKIF